MQCVVMTTLEAGDTLDHYRLEATVGRGGMSTLYRATDLRNGRQVAHQGSASGDGSRPGSGGALSRARRRSARSWTTPAS